ncbi:MAG: PD-(D/E)XK nuclease family protein [Cyanobacteria bacterium Co-bin13]|nr:PD-(D/E)XK nuclease family protein [Cyanobacteria bacterium Co-bin13]
MVLREGAVQLVHYRAKRVKVDRRWYYEIEGHRFPGVTTILSATKPQADREALRRWQQSVGVDVAKQITGRSASVGTRLHRQIAAYLKGDAVEIAPELADHWTSVAPLLGEIEEVLLVEGAVWHGLGFVGFPDALVVYRGELCLCDWKTARKPKQLDWIADYCFQVAAYRAAVNAVYSDLGLEVSRAMVAIALDDQPAQRFELSAEDLTSYWEGFQQRLRQFQSFYG